MPEGNFEISKTITETIAAQGFGKNKNRDKP